MQVLCLEGGLLPEALRQLFMRPTRQILWMFITTG
jgi:hypothetical protein